MTLRVRIEDNEVTLESKARGMMDVAIELMADLSTADRRLLTAQVCDEGWPDYRGLSSKAGFVVVMAMHAGVLHALQASSSRRDDADAGEGVECEADRVMA